jgi:hypothetical protein
MPHKSNQACCDHGGKRNGCGRKPGVKTQPIRLPAWLLEQLSEEGNPRQLIIDACLAQHPSICNEGPALND